MPSTSTKNKSTTSEQHQHPKQHSYGAYPNQKTETFKVVVAPLLTGVCPLAALPLGDFLSAFLAGVAFVDPFLVTAFFAAALLARVAFGFAAGLAFVLAFAVVYTRNEHHRQQTMFVTNGAMHRVAEL